MCQHKLHDYIHLFEINDLLLSCFELNRQNNRIMLMTSKMQFEIEFSQG